MSKMKLLSPDNFKLELANMYNLCKSRQLSKEQVVSKILIHLSAYEIKLLHSKILNALGPRDRDDQMTVREHCKVLLITHYEDNRIGHILQSESLHSPNRLF